ncbi:MAG: ATP-binding cassette domain-containing protein [Spirochaetes bacterium]|jgi:ATPase subunit of ABC transporter with duplicated ATPase domains|nr:ATP-binding cassette domain-containing protein [Spirochaetota bacterium]
MITVSDVSLSFGEQLLFKNVNIKFTPGNCYGVIGANGAGKSTFLKILSGDIQPDTGEVNSGPDERIAVLKQDQFQFDEYPVLHTVIMGHEHLYKTMTEKDAIYSKEDFSDEDGIRASELEAEFADLGGWESESEAAQLLSGLGIEESLHDTRMGELEGAQKVRVLLAQALFGDPDILLLDEPTNNLDLESITWLENFLYNFRNTVIVVSHDRHFLNRVSTHIADIDFGKITVFVGNYDFWYHSSQLARRQMRDDKKRREEKVAELKAFIQRFASNAARSKQATSRQKLLNQLTIDDIKPSSRKAPYINFKPNREPGKSVLELETLTVPSDDADVIRDLSMDIHPGDKIAFVGPYHRAKTALFEVLAGNAQPTTGRLHWGQTISVGYYPKDSAEHFDSDQRIIDWLQQFTNSEDPSFVRGFLGRMLFSGDEALKRVSVLSGGERVRCMLAKLMLTGANLLILDEPTNHLDLEAITALNDALIDFSGNVLFVSHDHEFVDTVANRVVEFTPGGVIDRRMRFDDYLASEDIRSLRDQYYSEHHLLEI